MKTLVHYIRAAVLVALLSTSASAQGVVQKWARSYAGIGGDSSYAANVAVDGMHNVIVAGPTGNGAPGAPGFDFYTAKYAVATGDLLWEKRYNGPSGDDYLTGMTVDSGGNVIVTGFSAGIGSNYDYYTAKYAASNGELLWEQRYNGPGNSSDEPVAVAVDDNGDVIVTGSSQGVVKPDFFTIKYAGATGAILWQRRLPGSGGHDYASAMALDNAGNVIVTGKIVGVGLSDDYYTAKLAGVNGAVVWERAYNGPASEHDGARAVTVDSNGNVIVTGVSRGIGGGDDYYTAKYAASNGAILWEKRVIGAAGGIYYSTVDLAVDAADNIVFTGPKIVPGSNTDIYTAKYGAATGALIWEKGFSGEANVGEGSSVVKVDALGDVFVSGYTFPTASESGKYITLKYAGADGAKIWEQTYGGLGALDSALALTSDGGVVVALSPFTGAKNEMATVYYTPDTVTLAPSLLSPVSSSTIVGTMLVNFSLPEAALRNSVKLNIGATVLTLAESQETSGAHSFSFAVSNPTASAQIASGSPVPDGVFAVTLSYQDIFGNPAAVSAAATSVTVDTTTLTATLTAPAANSFINSTVNVAFTLPEAAQPGSVTLTFAGPVTRVLTLAGSQETAGARVLSFDAGNPSGSPEVASGAAIPDGVYAVTLSYRDAMGNPAASSVAANVTLDTVRPVVGGDFSPLMVVEGTPLPDYRLQATGDSVSYTQNPPPGTITTVGAEGRYGVYIYGTDAAGNEGQRFFYVRVILANPQSELLASKGAPVPGAGEVGSEIPAGAVWSSFGVPSVNDAGQVAVLASYKVGGKIMAGTFTGGPGAVTLRLLTQKGTAAPGIANAMMSALKDPLLGPDGAVAWVATLANAPGTTRAVDSTNNVAIFLDPDGAGPGAAYVVARKGAEATTTSAVWSGFTSVALGADAVAFTGTLLNKTGGVSLEPGGVTTLNDSGLWMHHRDSATTTLALREGDALLGSTVKTINALVARPGSPGQGRGVASDTAQDYTVLRATLADNRKVVGYAGQDGVTAFAFETGGDATDYGTGAKWLSLGLPTQAEGSTAMAFVGTVKPGTGTATSTNNVAIFAGDDVDYEAIAVVKKGDATGVSGGIFSAFKDPVNGLDRSVAFVGTMKANSAAGIGAANNDGIWHRSDSSALTLIAREGAQPPDAPLGAQWKAFTSLALAEGRGPLFLATMHSKTGTTSPGPGGVTTADDVGLWATDSLGTLRLLMREGDAISSSTVKTITVLSSVPGSPAQPRSFDRNGNVIVRVTDTSNAQHLVLIAVP